MQAGLLTDLRLGTLRGQYRGFVCTGGVTDRLTAGNHRPKAMHANCTTYIFLRLAQPLGLGRGYGGSLESAWSGLSPHVAVWDLVVAVVSQCCLLATGIACNTCAILRIAKKRHGAVPSGDTTACNSWKSPRHPTPQCSEHSLMTFSNNDDVANRGDEKLGTARILQGAELEAMSETRIRLLRGQVNRGISS